MRKSVWFLSAGLMALATPAYAQDGDAEADQATDAAADDAAVQDDEDVGAIVITATRRNEALSDVPLAVSAVTAETLRNSGADDIRALTQVSPSLLVSSTSSEAAGGVARIRGVGTVGDNAGLESSVAVFIDGVYRSRTGTGLTELGAIDRIEVLRGPQGTLFGRNASAGLLSIITAKPRFDREINASLTYGNYDTRRAEASITGPLGENVAGRIDGVYLKRDGFLKDVISGRSVNDRDRYLVRGQLLYEPSSDLSIRLIGDYSNRDEECCAATYLPAVNVSGDGTVYGPNSVAALQRALGAFVNDDTFKREIAITPGRDYRSDVEDWGLSIEGVYDFGGAELTSISAYRSNKYIRGQDAHFNDLDVLYRPGDGSGFTKFDTFTQEFRLQGEAMDNRLDWLVGAYFANEKLELQDNLSYGDDYLRYTNCVLIGALLAPALAPTNDPDGTCINPVVLAGAQAQVNAGIAQVQAGIAAVQGALAMDPTNPVLLGQLAALQAQLAALIGTAQQLAILNLDPTNPGFGSISTFLGTGGDPFAGVGISDNFNQTSNNFALFTHNIFSVTDRLDITIGLRYTRESKKLQADLRDNNDFCRAISGGPLAVAQQLPCVAPAVPNGRFVDSDKRTEDEISGTAVISYDITDDLMGYVSYSRGYKAGGFNLDRTALARDGGNGAVQSTASVAALQFDSEINNAYEIGFKYDGRGIDINLAAFQQDFDDFQLNQFNGLAFEVANISGCSQLDVEGGDTDNSLATGACTGKLKPGVRSRGVEFEIFSRPIRNVSVNVGGTYVDTKYRHNLVGNDGVPLSPSLFQLAGRRLSNSNQLTLTGAVTWTPPIGDTGLTGLFYIDGRHVSAYNTGSDLDVQKRQPGFEVFNGRIGLRGPDDAWAVEVWAQNLLDKNYTQVAFDAPIQGSGTDRGVAQGFYSTATQMYGVFLAEPRTYGLTLRGKF